MTVRPALRDLNPASRIAPSPRRTLQAVLMLLWLIALPALAADVERIEPGNWWVGMQSERLQLMVYGEGIAASTPRIEHPQVRIERVTRTGSDNHLFIDLRIDPATEPGEVAIAFQRGDAVETVAYPLLAREPGSAQRKGFGPEDVILNLMPDRFANGDPGNDSIAGMEDRADRGAPSGRHGGDLQGLSERLDYIAGMGFTMIWPTPVVENDMPRHSYHGYAATDFYRVDPRLGSNEDYRRLVARARENGIGVIHDIVPNHIGIAHPWMSDLPAADWITHDARFVPTRHTRTAISDPYAAEVDAENFTRGWFVASMPDLNQRNPLLATYLVQNAIWWIEYAGLSGFRVDTVGYSDTQFLMEWNRRILEEYPDFSIVGEEWSANPLMVARWQQPVDGMAGDAPGMPNMMDFPVSETLRRALVADESQGGGLDELYTMLVNDTLYPQPHRLVLFEGNHDMPRLYSALGEDLDLYRMALVYLATMPRIPQLYYGTEVLMQSPTQRDDAAARRDFPGGWAGDAVSAFDGRGLSEAQRGAQAFVRTLLNWRKQAGVIHHGQMLHYAPQDAVYVYFRHHQDERVMVVLNKQHKKVMLDLSRYAQGLAGARRATPALGGDRFTLGQTLAVPARGAMILMLE